MFKAKITFSTCSMLICGDIVTVYNRDRYISSCHLSQSLACLPETTHRQRNNKNGKKYNEYDVNK